MPVDKRFKIKICVVWQLNKELCSVTRKLPGSFYVSLYIMCIISHLVVHYQITQTVHYHSNVWGP